MPIRPEMKDKYSPHWKAIRMQVLVRAGGQDPRVGACCEECGVRNYTLVHSKHRSRKYRCDSHEKARAFRSTKSDGCEYTIVVLTIAHLDHDPENNDLSNLRALCQRCHLAHDKDHHAETRRNRKAVGELPGVEP